MIRKAREVGPANRRGSREAVAKRVSARQFNELLQGDERRHDGRSEKRRKRLLQELKTGTRGPTKSPLKPVDVLQHAAELLELGETLASLRKVARYDRVFGAVPADGLLDALSKLHAAYRFRPEVYRFVGIDDRTLERAGVLPKRAKGTT